MDRIVFFDGVCNLCSTTVDTLMALDKKRVLKYASLQGETAKKLLSEEKIQNLDSIVFYEDGEIFERSEAIGKILCSIGSIYKLAGKIVLFFPLSITDLIYKFIARNRYKFFGKKDTCRLPTAEERSYFLD